MLKNLIILPDGTEIFSGDTRDNAIISCTYTQCVNDGTELSVGSVCSNELELKLFAAGSLSVAAGDEIQYYKVDDSGARTKIGVFRCEKPTITGMGTYKFVAYDRVSRLDKDLTEWLEILDGWPYTVSEFASMVCEACGLALAATPIDYAFDLVSGDLILTYNSDEPKYSIDDSGHLVLYYSGAYSDVSIDDNGHAISASGRHPIELINGGYKIRKFSGTDITGRMLMRWLGQITCRFVRANANGEIEFAWYADRGAEIATNSDFRFFAGSLSYEDYQVAEIQKVQIRASDSDNGTVYPDSNEEELNTYKITGNYLLTAETDDELKSVAQAIYEQLQGAAYTPCKVSIQATTEINAGDIIHVTDRNGVRITAYVMSKTNKGQKDTLECTGSSKRDSSTATNEITLRSLSGKVLNIQKSIDGLRVENRDMAGNLAALTLTVDGISAKVETLDGNYSALDLTVGEISAEVGNAQEEITKLALTLDGLTITDSGGTTKINGSSVDTENLHVKAANIDGKLTASQINATNLHVKAANIDGALTFGDGSYFIDPSGTEDYLKLPGLEIASDGASFSGTVTATYLTATEGGNIAGFKIAPGSMKSEASGYGLGLFPSGVYLGDNQFFVVIYKNGGAEPVGGLTASGWQSIS